MGIGKAFHDPLFVVAISALLGVAIAAAWITLPSDDGEADVDVVASASPAPTSTAAPQASATPAISYADVLNDTRRLLDLANARDALDAYYRSRGTYPSTSGAFSTLCAKPDDAGCKLTEVAPALSVNDGEQPYWYQSDGASYTLFAHVTNPQPVSGCPDEVPPELEGQPVSCLRKGRP